MGHEEGSVNISFGGFKVARRLDESRDYSLVIGVPGVRWEQGGQYFRADGHPMIIEDGRGIPAPHVEATTPEVQKDIKELRAMAKVYGVEGYQQMTLEQLREALS